MDEQRSYAMCGRIIDMSSARIDFRFGNLDELSMQSMRIGLVALLWAQAFFNYGAGSLKDAASFGMGVGIADRIPQRSADWPLLKAQFDYVTPENCMKPDPIQREEGKWAWEVPDAFVEFATEHDLKVVGHCLVWAKDDRTPPWFAMDGDKPVSREVLLQRMERHINTVVGRYRGKIAMWDVVNEALDDGTNYLRPSVWSKNCGEDFIVKAFEYAHAADPNAVLIYNDYNNELAGKLPKLLRLIETLRARKVRCMRSVCRGITNWIPSRLRRLKPLKKMKELGMKVVVSELDIDVIPRARWWANGGAERETLAKVNPYKNGCPPEILQRRPSNTRGYSRFLISIPTRSCG